MPEPIIILFAVLAVSALGATGLCHGKTEERPVWIMMFVGYFWLLAFIQLFILAAVYYFQHLK